MSLLPRCLKETPACRSKFLPGCCTDYPVCRQDSVKNARVRGIAPLVYRKSYIGVRAKCSDGRSLHDRLPILACSCTNARATTLDPHNSALTRRLENHAR